MLGGRLFALEAKAGIIAAAQNRKIEMEKVGTLPIYG